MNDLYIAMVLSVLILLASMISVELGMTVAIVEIALGVVAQRWFAPPGADESGKGQEKTA